MQQSRSLGSPATVILPVATAAAAIAIFVADNETGNEVAVAVLYAVVVLMAARFLSTRGITFVAAGVCGLTGVSYALSQSTDPRPEIANTLISLTTIALTTLLAVQAQRSGAAHGTWRRRPFHCSVMVRAVA